MDTIPGNTTHSKSEKQISVQILTPTPHSLKSSTQEPPLDITNTPVGNVPPPQFMNSITELRSFSTALSEFLSRYDELHYYLHFINSSIDAKLPNQNVDATNPKQSAQTHLFGTVNDCPEVTVSNQNPKQGARDCERSLEVERTSDGISCLHDYEESDTSKKPDDFYVSKKHEEIDVCTNPVQIDTLKKSEVADISKNDDETDASKMHVECDTSKKPEVVDASKNDDEIDASKMPVECDTLKKPEVVDVSNNTEEIDAFMKPVEIDTLKNIDKTAVSKKHAESDASKKPEVVDVSNNTEEIDAFKKTVEIDTLKNIDETVVSKKHAESDASKKPEESVPETSCDQLIIPDVTISEQNPNGIGTDCEQIFENLSTPGNLEEIDVPKKPEVVDVSDKPEHIDILNKPEEIDILKENEQTDICKNAEEIDVSMKPEVTYSPEKPEQSSICKNPEEIDVLQKPEEIDTSMNLGEIDVLHKPEEIDTSVDMDWEEIRDNDTSKIPEETDILKKTEQTEICKNPEEIDSLKKKHAETSICKKVEEINVFRKHEETKTSKRSIISVLESLCKSMSAKELKSHVAKHYSEMNKLHNEIAKALKLAKDPADLVLTSIGRFFVQGSRTFCKDLDGNKDKQIVGRLASILILQCFVMIGSDGIKIAKEDQKYAAESAVDWRNRMIREGGFGHADEVDARGLLFLISGFGIQDHVFKIRDIADLIRASNVKGISASLRRSVILLRKIPEVVDLMVKNNLEIEAADIAFSFRVEDKCRPRNILATYLHKRLNDNQKASSLQMLDAMKQQLSDLKSVKQCLESHNIDPSTVLRDFDKKIQNLEKEIKEVKSIQKRKSLEKPIHREPKRVCRSRENMPYQQKPVNHYDINPYKRSPQPRTSYIDQNPCNNYYHPSPDRLAGGYHGSHDQMVYLVNGQPYVRQEPYGQHYSRYDQTPPYGWGQPEFSGARVNSPSLGFPGRRGPSADLYGFADIVEKQMRGFRSSGA